MTELYSQGDATDESLMQARSYAESGSRRVDRQISYKKRKIRTQARAAAMVLAAASPDAWRAAKEVILAVIDLLGEQPADLLREFIGNPLTEGPALTRAIPITYGEFHDLPRMIQFHLGGQWFFMRSYFDEDRDEYADYYDVYLLPFHSDDEVKANPDYWRHLEKAHHLGRIAVGEVGLDETRRRSLDAAVIEPWLLSRMQELSPR